MKKKFALILCLLLALGSVSACAGPSAEGAASQSSSSVGESAVSAEGVKSTGPDDTSEHYAFTIYANYDWFSIKPFGEDAASKYMSDKFNIDIDWRRPDADASAKLNLMISSNSLPDSMVVDRGVDFIRLIKAGALQDLAQYQYEGNYFDEIIPPVTQEMLKVEGAVYGVPNWPIIKAGGGNASWLVNQDVWKAVGSPEMKTLEDVHKYLLAVKGAGLKSHMGEDIIPFMTDATGDGYIFLDAFNRSFGAPPLAENWFSILDNEIKFCMRDERVNSALKEANKWYREGLFSDANFTDTKEQVTEKLVNGRPAITYYDFSQDSFAHFRQNLIQNSGGNSYELLVDPIFPPANGVERVYGEYNASVGWNLNVITTAAKRPQRIFDFYAWQLSKEGSIVMMYGPQGGLWDELDADGNPVLKTPEAELTPEQKDAAGCWFWAQPAHSDNVNDTKYAVNAALPLEKQDFTITTQANIFTPKGDGAYVNGQKFVTDEFVGLSDTIDPVEDLGVKRKLITDQCKMQIPKIITSVSDEDFEKNITELLSFAQNNGVSEIEARYTERFRKNCDIQGGSFFELNK